MPARKAWCVLTGVIVAAGCGGGNSPNGTGGPWLPFAGQGIFAVNVAAPTAAPITVDSTSNVGGLRLVQSGTYDPTTGAASSPQPDTAVWAAAGKIWRASTAAGRSPSAMQVSSENSVGDPSPLNPTPTHLCDTSIVTDWATPGDSRYFYTLAGQDTQCGTADDVVKVTRVAAPTTEAPITVPGRFVAAAQSPSAGAITGWLVIDATGRLVRTDAVFANPTQLVASVGFAFDVGGTPTGRLLLLQSGNQVVVQRFDPVAGTLDPTALFTLPGGITSTVGARAQDSTNVYMMVFNGSSGSWSLYRLALAATQAGSAVQMTSEAGRTPGFVLLLTTNMVAFTVRVSGTDALVGVSKTAAGTAAAPPLGPAQTTGAALTPIAAAGDKVYFNVVENSGRSALAVNEAGSSVISQASALWVGFANLGGSSTGVLASGVSPSGNCGGASLTTVVGTTGASGIALGTLAADIASLDRLHWSGSNGLFRGFTPGPGPTLYGDILFADVATAGSLFRVTNTPSVSESLP